MTTQCTNCNQTFTEETESESDLCDTCQRIKESIQSIFDFQPLAAVTGIAQFSLFFAIQQYAPRANLRCVRSHLTLMGYIESGDYWYPDIRPFDDLNDMDMEAQTET